MGCIQSASFAILMNGSPSNLFIPSRGLRQGCPLFPFLFLLIAKDLSRLLHKAKEVRLIKGVKVSNQTELTHVLFVDDVLMFGVGTFSNIQNLEKVLKNYQVEIGMEINLENQNYFITIWMRRS